jgi:hypothetical protein
LTGNGAGIVYSGEEIFVPVVAFFY